VKIYTELVIKLLRQLRRPVKQTNMPIKPLNPNVTLRKIWLFETACVSALVPTLPKFKNHTTQKITHLNFVLEKIY
jgi:hypothetical protein